MISANAITLETMAAQTYIIHGPVNHIGAHWRLGASASVVSLACNCHRMGLKWGTVWQYLWAHLVAPAASRAHSSSLALVVANTKVRAHSSSLALVVAN